ncbi:hypothetical protein Salat_1052000 [Sesamum alatum]|uniref:Uncharacterized protein n=1 Tax=Sesamum alatum TaxID=300844 RepID=A0AAE1YNJ6_9LAMI|nr:hypothetical protein Salat_1052000 [Sesamum alatum]
MTRSNPSLRAKAVTNVCWKYVPKPTISAPIQQKHLYTPIWNSAHDQYFIDALWDKAMAGCSDVDSFNNIESIKYATTVASLVMKERFPLAKAYEHFGEPNYTALRAIFEGCVPHGAGPRVVEDGTMKLLMWMQSLRYRRGRTKTEIVGLLGSKSCRVL